MPKVSQKNFVVQIAWKRTRKQNKNYIIVICGGTGSGKSWLALKLAEEIDKGFNSDRIFFQPQELFQMMAGNRPPKGSVIIFDEAGLGIGSRDWRTDINKATSKIMQLFRFENLILIMTVPGLGFIDSQVRRLIHAYMEPTRIDYSKQKTWFKFHHFQYNPRLDKIYFHRQGGIDFWAMGRPSQKIIDAYEEKKREFAEGFYKAQADTFTDRDRDISIAKEIDKEDMPATKKAEKFAELTGKVERNFWRYRKKSK